MVVKYIHHGDDLVGHRTREASFGAQCTKHSANSMCFKIQTNKSVLCIGPVIPRVRNLRKMQNIWANFTDFEPEISIIKCKTKKLKYFNARL